MKKIIFVAQSLRKGGAERVVSLLSQQFKKMGYDVKIILWANEVEYSYGGEIIDINFPASKSYLIKALRLFQRIKKLKQIFKQEKPDFIFSFMESCNFASILTGYNVVVSIRNNPNKKHNWYQKKLIKFLYNFSNVVKVVAVSKTIENILNNQYRIRNTKTILNPIVLDETYKIKEDLNKFKPFILSVGRLNPQKNFTMLIESFYNSRAKDDFRLLIIGEGKERNNLELLIDNLKLNDKVFLLGQKDNIKDYYLQCDIYVLSSKFEGFPNVLIEALSNSCACISTDCPTGPSEIIKNNENGILVKNENQEALSEAIDELYFNKELKEKFRQNAQKSIKHLEIEKIAKEWLEL